MASAQLPLTFDAPAALRSKEQAISQVESNTSEEWARQAERAVMVVARKYEDFGFTSDDVWLELQLRNVKRPHINDALGPVMVRLRKAGVIRCTDDYRPSSRPASHRQPKRVWRKA